MESIKGTCQFESMDANDLFLAVETLSSHSSLCRMGVYHDKIGDGFERFLEWAIVDINTAAKDTILESQARLATNAVMNARRALSCLVDQYLLRDGFAFCKNPPRDAERSARTLVSHKVFDDLTARVLQRTVEKEIEQSISIMHYP